MDIDVIVSESAGELVALAVAGIGAAGVSGLGLVLESAGVHDVLAGQVGVGAWEMAVGGLVLFVGAYLLGYERFYRHLRDAHGE